MITDPAVRRYRNTMKAKKTLAKYRADFIRSGCLKRATRSNSGEAAEYFVAADLLHRGLEVTKPLNRNGGDDLHVRTEKGWRNIQVKVGLVNTKTKTLSVSGGGGGRAKVTSDILALVDLIGRRIAYEALRGKMPVELL